MTFFVAICLDTSVVAPDSVVIYCSVVVIILAFVVKPDDIAVGEFVVSGISEMISILMLIRF